MRRSPTFPHRGTPVPGDDWDDWITRGVGRIFPREWQRFAAVPEALRPAPLVDAYATLLFDSDRDIRERAASEWCAWEDAHVSLAPGHVPNPEQPAPATGGGGFKELLRRLFG